MNLTHFSCFYFLFVLLSICSPRGLRLTIFLTDIQLSMAQLVGSSACYTMVTWICIYDNVDSPSSPRFFPSMIDQVPYYQCQYASPIKPTVFVEPRKPIPGHACMGQCGLRPQFSKHPKIWTLPEYRSCAVIYQ